MTCPNCSKNLEIINNPIDSFQNGHVQEEEELFDCTNCNIIFDNNLDVV